LTSTQKSKSRVKPTPENRQGLSTDFMMAALDESLMVNNHINIPKPLDSNLFKSTNSTSTLFLETKNSFKKDAQKIEK
jgi:hypothetical protein